MINKILTAGFMTASLAAHAEHQFITCDNYKEAIVQQSPADYEPNVFELDCSQNNLNNITYQAQLHISPEKDFDTNGFTTTGHGGPTLDRGLIPLTDEQLIERYFPDNNGLKQMVNRYTKRSDSDLDQMIVNTIVHHMINLPHLSIEQNLSLSDGQTCLQHERARSFANTGYTHVRKSEYISTADKSVQAWFVSGCQGSNATLFIQDTNNSDEVKSYTLPIIDHSFATFSGSKPYHVQTFNELKGISDDGKTIMIQLLDDNSDSSNALNFNVVSQLATIVYKNDKIYALPLQKLISHNDFPHVRLSADGSKVVVASEYSVKLFEYNNELDQFVLAGLYQHKNTKPLSTYNFQVSHDGLSVYLEIESKLHQIQFTK